MNVLNVLIVFSLMHVATSFQQIGCFKNSNDTDSESAESCKECIEKCRGKKYRYAGISGRTCQCHNWFRRNDARLCDDRCRQRSALYGSEDDSLLSVYWTGTRGKRDAQLDGREPPPTNLTVRNVTTTSAEISWRRPATPYPTVITGYSLLAEVTRSYSDSVLHTQFWTYSNDTYRNDIGDLTPGTQYNVSVRAIYVQGPGEQASVLFETIIGEPDEVPEKPVILKREGSKMVIRPALVTNSNGPVTAYRFVVIAVDSMQVVDTALFQNYQAAQSDGIAYYIAAQISAQDATREFVIGDGRTYGSFYNAPLNKEINYQVVEGVVSVLNGVTRIRYPDMTDHTYHPSKVDVLPVADSSSILVVSLSVAVGLASVLLIIALVACLILRRRYHQGRRRRRLNDTQELSVHGPMIQVENHGYVSEETDTAPVNHYRALKNRVRTIPREQVRVNDGHQVLGVGTFGHVLKGDVIQEDGAATPSAIYIVCDQDLRMGPKRQMLRDLDVLIKTGKHDNLISLLGVCESPEKVYVALEFSDVILKELLLRQRDDPTALSEKDVLQLSAGVARGLDHLCRKNIVHGRVCARNVMLLRQEKKGGSSWTAKLAGHGLTRFDGAGCKTLDCRRWSAPEVLLQQQQKEKEVSSPVPSLSSSSDVWSVGCLMWEMACLGGTPHSHLLDIRQLGDELRRGVRLAPPTLCQADSPLYQLMLDCWQLNRDGRISIAELLAQLTDLAECDQPTQLGLSFSVQADVVLEPYVPRLEYQEVETR